MKPLTPYLFFDGNCREAMKFYQSCLGGELEMYTYAEAPEGVQCPEGNSPPAKDKIMHACLRVGDLALMASDNPASAPLVGDNVSLSMDCETIQRTQEFFAVLSSGGKVVMPLADTFWGAHFGMFTDKYGFNWMLSCPIEKK